MKLLVVEDEPMIRRGICHLLKTIEFEGIETNEILEAADGMQAQQLLKQQFFDIVFTDIRMPDMDGLTLIANWAGKTPQTQWVIISGFDLFEYAQSAITFGVKDYLLKPVTKAKIKETVDRLVAQRAGQQFDFIEMREFRDVFDQFLDFIWMLDVECLNTALTSWLADLNERNLEITYYLSLLNQMVSLLSISLNRKGSFQLQDNLLQVAGADRSEAAEQFIAACLGLMDAIKQKRKQNWIDPIEAAKRYMQENLSAKLNLEEVANKLGLNPTYFSQLFKKETGETFIDYRMRLRMDRAKQLLEQPNLRMIDVAMEVGYNDVPHFIKTFKRLIGYTPAEYRAKLGIDL